MKTLGVFLDFFLLICCCLFSSSQIAIHIDYESYGLIFGFNTLIALVLQTVLTAIVNSWLKLYVRTQVSKWEQVYSNIPSLFLPPVCHLWLLLLCVDHHLYFCRRVQDIKDWMYR